MSEIQITDLELGTGREAVKGAKVTVHYDGYLEDGRRFDSSIDRGRPFSFVLGAGKVIQGWDQGLLGMREGGRRKLHIPSTLAYGARALGMIPPDSNLIFEVQLVESLPRE